MWAFLKLPDGTQLTAEPCRHMGKPDSAGSATPVHEEIPMSNEPLFHPGGDNHEAPYTPQGVDRRIKPQLRPPAIGSIAPPWTGFPLPCITPVFPSWSQGSHPKLNHQVLSPCLRLCFWRKTRQSDQVTFFRLEGPSAPRKLAYAKGTPPPSHVSLLEETVIPRVAPCQSNPAGTSHVGSKCPLHPKLPALVTVDLTLSLALRLHQQAPVCPPLPSSFPPQCSH